MGFQFQALKTVKAEVDANAHLIESAEMRLIVNMGVKERLVLDEHIFEVFY